MALVRAARAILDHGPLITSDGCLLADADDLDTYLRWGAAAPLAPAVRVPAHLADALRRTAELSSIPACRRITTLPPEAETARR